MGSPANSSSLITSPRNPWPLPLSACSQPWLLRLRLMPMLSMATMAMATTSAMPTMATVMAWDTTAIPMPTMDTTTARGPLMPRLLPPLRPPPRLRLMPMLTMVSTDMAFPTPAMDTVLPTTDTDMPTMDTTDIPIPTTVTTTARGPLMLRLLPLLRPMLMLTTDTTVMPAPMPTDTTDTPVPTDTATPTAMDSDTTDKM